MNRSEKRAETRGRRAKWYHKLGLLLFSLIFVFGILELVARAFFPTPLRARVENLNTGDLSRFPSPKPKKKLKDGTLMIEQSPDFGLYVFTPTGTRLKKNARAIVTNHHLGVKGKIEIRTNSLGFRHRELGEKKAGDRRVLVLGDSITLGDWAPQSATYPSRISHYLNQAREKGTNEIEVINAGIGSVDVQTEYAVLMENGLKAKPDVVVLGLYLNDAYDSPKVQVTRLPSYLEASRLIRLVVSRFDRFREPQALASRPKEEMLAPERRRFRASIDRRVREVLQRHGKLDPARRERLERELRNFFDLVSVDFGDWGYAWSDGYWKRVLPIVELMQLTARDRDFELVVVLFPHASQIYKFALSDNEPQQRFDAEMRDRGIKHLDLLPLLKKRAAQFPNPKAEDLYFDGCHYKKAGNDYIGKVIAKFLRENVPLLR